MFVIESATAKDVDQLVDLLSLLFDQEADFRPDREKQKRGLLLIIEKPSSGHIFVIRRGRTIAGMVNLLFTISTAEGGPAIILEDMIIHPDHRRNGLGSKLLEHAVDFAGRNGFSRITLLTDSVNEGAIRFYQRHGFTLSAMLPLRLSLG